MCLSTRVEKEKVMSFWCELIAAKISETYVACNIMAFRYGENFGERYSCIEIRVTNDLKKFQNVDGDRCIL